MNAADLSEGVTVTGTILDALLALITGPTSLTSSQLAYQVGLFRVNASSELNASPSGSTAFWTDMSKCFDTTVTMGVTFAQMDTVRAAALALTPIGLPGIAVKNYAARLALVAQARILAAMTFTSRQQVDDYFDQIDASFSAAEEVAAGNLDNVSYMALVKLHAAVSNDLSTRARPLPQMVTYSYATVHSALWMAQNMYQDPSRFSELIDENSPIHPLFMPASGRALAI